MTFRSRTDLNVQQLPSTIPVMGPAGSIVTDPAFGCQIIRATDENSILLSGKPSAFCTAGDGGSADVNVWNMDSTMLYVQDAGGGGFILSFNPLTLAVKRIFTSFRPIGGCVFSRVSPTVLFNLNGTQFLQYDLSNQSLSTPPAPVLVCDFAEQLPATATWKSIGGVENGDTVFTAAFSTAGDQGTGIYACCYIVGCGYRTWNTETGVVSGTFGTQGTVSFPDRFTIHNVKGNKTGQWLVVAATTKFAGAIGEGPYLWNINTLQVGNIGVVWGGHWTAGYCEFYNWDSSDKFGIPYGAHVRRSLYNLGQPNRIANPSPTPTLMTALDDHVSMNGQDSSLLISGTAWVVPVGSPLAPFPAAWYNEIIGFDLTGTGIVWRFCHTFTRGSSGNFYADNAIACGDQLNTFVAFTSDWMGTLSGERADVFIVALK
jgi:hypothetical protein